MAKLFKKVSKPKAPEETPKAKAVSSPSLSAAQAREVLRTSSPDPDTLSDKDLEAARQKALNLPDPNRRRDAVMSLTMADSCLKGE